MCVCVCLLGGGGCPVVVGAQWWRVPRRLVWPGYLHGKMVYETGGVPGSQICCRWSHAFLCQSEGEQAPMIRDIKYKYGPHESPRHPLPPGTHTHTHLTHKPLTQTLDLNHICNAFLCPRRVYIMEGHSCCNMLKAKWKWQ